MPENSTNWSLIGTYLITCWIGVIDNVDHIGTDFASTWDKLIMCSVLIIKKKKNYI